MHIGKELKQRMDLLRMNITKLSQLSFVDEKYIEDILNNNISYNEIDDFDLSLISSALHCRKEYFFDKSIRDKDLLFNSCLDKDKAKSIEAKGKLQDFINDFLFLKQIK